MQKRPDIEHSLVSGEIDVGVSILSNLEDRHVLQTEELSHSPTVYGCRPSIHCWSTTASISPASPMNR
ncbi:hypothetical protein EMIT0347P_40242 [Pseudomonas sp. IT-347P]